MQEASKPKTVTNQALTMVWKIRRNGNGSGKDNNNAPAIRGPVTVKSCLKKDSDDRSKTSTISSKKCFDYNSGPDQSTARSNGSRSEGSRSHGSHGSGSLGSKSLHSRLTDNFSQWSGRQAAGSSEQPSVTSSSADGSQESKGSSKNSVRAAPAAPAAASHASQRSSSSSHREKVVRFHDIHIRDYERVVGDNPSCSSGPPVGIGWSYGKTRTVNVNSYEEARPYRRSQVDMVLTREEREALLLAWGVSFHDIVDSIRSNVRVKNQRRQTVTNLGKVERLEEAFESATRKLKRAVLLRRRTGNKVKELKEQSELAQQKQTLATLRIAEERALNEIDRDCGRIEHEPEEDNLEHLEVEVSVSDFCRNSPAESKVRGAPISVSTDDDGASSMDGLTIGNSTTASVLEMEKFYRELELEMFGEDPPPSMVGRTLEVPGIEIPEEDRVYNDLESVIPEPASVYGPEDTVYDDDEELDQAPTSKGFPIDSSYARSYPSQTPPVHHGYMSNGYSAHVQPNDSYRGQHDQGRSMLSRSLEYETDSTALHRQHNHSVEGHAYCHDQYHSQNVYPPQEAPMPMNPHLMNSRLSSSLDNADVIRPHNIMFHVQPPIHHPVPPPAISSHHSYTFGASDLPLMTEQTKVPERHQVRPPRDEPQVRHCPPPTYLSPTHWMEDRDSPRDRHMHEPVTITEDSYGAPNHGRSMKGIPTYGSYQPTTVQRFPASFY